MITPKKPDTDKTIFSPAEACFFMGLSWNTLKGLIRRGEISVARAGRRYLIPKEAIERFADRGNLKAKIIARNISLK